MKFYLFNVSNPDEIQQGGKPMLREMGPYTYLVDFEKFDITKNSTRDTVKYKQNRTFYFQEDMSKGSDEDQITMMNVLFIVRRSSSGVIRIIDFSLILLLRVGIIA